MASGNEQVLAMARLNQPKVDKRLIMPTGYGVTVDKIFLEFNKKYRDEWKRCLVSSEAAKGVAAEWKRSLGKFADDDVISAMWMCILHNSMPVTLSTFIGVCDIERAKRQKAPVKQTKEISDSGRKAMRQMVGLI